MGITIFKRSQHNVEITPEGQVVIAYAKNVEKEYEKLVAAIRELKAGFEDGIAVGYLAAASQPFLTNSYDLFQRRYPDTHVRLKRMDPDEIRQALSDGSIDMGISADSYIEIAPPLRMAKIYEDEYCLCVSENHELAQKKEIKKADLAGKKLALPDKNYLPLERMIIEDALSGVPYRLSRRGNQGLNDAALIVSNDTVAIPLLSHVKFMEDRNLVYIPFEEGLFEKVSIIAVWNGDRESESIRNFIDCILACGKSD